MTFSDTTKYWKNKTAPVMSTLSLRKLLEGDGSDTSEGQERRPEVQGITSPLSETGEKNFLGFENSQYYINISEETVNKSLAMVSKLNENLEKVLKYFSAYDETPTATDNTDVPSTSSANPPPRVVVVPFEMKDASNQSEQEPNHSTSLQMNVTINAWSVEKVILQELLRDSGLPLLVSNCSLLTIAENLVAKDQKQSKAMNCRPVVDHMHLFLLSFQERVRVSFMSLLGKWNRLGLEEKHQFSAALSRFSEMELSHNGLTPLKIDEKWLLTLFDSSNAERYRIAPHCETSGVVDLTQSPMNISIETAASSRNAILTPSSPGTMRPVTQQANSNTQRSSSTNQPMQPSSHDYQWVQPNPAQQPPNHEATNHSGNSSFRSYQNASELSNRISSTPHPTQTNPVPVRITKRRSTIHSAGDSNDLSLRPEQRMKPILQGLAKTENSVNIMFRPNLPNQSGVPSSSVAQAQPQAPPPYSLHEAPSFRYPTQVLNQSGADPMNAYRPPFNNLTTVHDNPIQVSSEIPGFNHQTNQCNMIGSHQSGQMNVAAPDLAASHNQNQNQYHMDGSQNSGQLQQQPAPSPAPVSFQPKRVNKRRFTAVDPCVSIEPVTNNNVAYHGPNSNHYTMPAMISNASRIPDNIDPNSIYVPSRPPPLLRNHIPTSNPNQTAVRLPRSYSNVRDPRINPNQPTAGGVLQPLTLPMYPHPPPSAIRTLPFSTSSNPSHIPRTSTNQHPGYPYSNANLNTQNHEHDKVPEKRAFRMPTSSVSSPTAGAGMPIHARRMSVFEMNYAQAQATRSPANLVIDEGRDPEHHS